MNLDKLLYISSKQWDELGDAEIGKILGPHLAAARPDPVAIAAFKEKKEKKRSNSKSNVDDLIRLAKQLGVVVPDRH